MHYLSKTFEVPMAHRLSKHQRRCKMFHGHNLKIEVTIKSFKLNENDMIMDFSDLKALVNSIIDSWDHGMFVNKCDEKQVDQLDCVLHTFDCDPTSEILCQYLYNKLRNELLKTEAGCNIFVHSVSIWETENSKSTYSE